MLVSGVWRLWLTPRRKSSLAASSSRSCVFWASTRANSWAFRIATAISLANSSRRSWSARSQHARRRQLPDQHAELLLAGLEDAPGPAAARRGSAPRAGCPGDRRGGCRSRSCRTPPWRRWRRGRPRTARRPAATPARSRRGCCRAPGSAARGRRRGGCGSRRVAPARRRPGPRSASRGRRRTPDRRPRRSPGAARSGRPRGDRRAGSPSSAAITIVRSSARAEGLRVGDDVARHDGDDPEPGQRQDRRRDEPERQPGPERQPDAQRDARPVVVVRVREIVDRRLTEGRPSPARPARGRRGDRRWGVAGRPNGPGPRGAPRHPRTWG